MGDEGTGLSCGLRVLITSVFGSNQASFTFFFSVFEPHFYIPLTTSLEGNWLLEAASRELKLLRGSSLR